jgi:transcriptional regulator with XRE-family HTH domain
VAGGWLPAGGGERDEVEWKPNNYALEEGRTTRTFGVMIRARRKELGLRQEDLSPRIEIEGRPVSQTHLSDLERGAIAPRPYLIEQFARALQLNRDVLYLAAGIVPPEVAEELNRLTPAEREEAWGVFKDVVAKGEARRKQREQQAEQKPKGRRGAG